MTNKKVDRRKVLKTGAAALVTGLAGCQDILDNDSSTPVSTESPTLTEDSTETQTETPTETPREMMSLEESHERRQDFWSYIPHATDIPYLDRNALLRPEINDVELKRRIAEQIGEEVKYGSAPSINQLLDKEISSEQIDFVGRYSDDSAKYINGYVDSEPLDKIVSSLTVDYEEIDTSWPQTLLEVHSDEYGSFLQLLDKERNLEISPRNEKGVDSVCSTLEGESLSHLDASEREIEQYGLIPDDILVPETELYGPSQGYRVHHERDPAADFSNYHLKWEPETETMSELLYEYNDGEFSKKAEGEVSPTAEFIDGTRKYLRHN
jgi:hypothetical protein